MSTDGEPSSDGELDSLLEEYCERARRGERPTIEEYIARRPDLTDDIRLLFSASQAMEDLASATAEEPGPPGRIGDFRIVREAGRGGMGIVYEAVQESLERRVALKVLTPALVADSNGLQRFRREARAAARLHHTNIVPIFGVGEEDGVNYYAMQFIDGQSLEAILETVRRRGGAGSQVLPDLMGSDREIRVDARERGGSSGSNSPERRHHRAVVRVGLQVAEALAYAHAQGILHRDIKPSNLLLDAVGTVWITDFGLAKADDDGKWSTPTLTQAGDIVGTIAYLAPERLEGKADGRSDVYALGLTLYELLTLQPAFKDDNRRRLLKRISEDTPSSPRQLDPTIPRDLETIILTATAKEPARRYASAARLADDLRSFLAGRPIAARRPSAIERLGSWCRREPGLASLGAMVLLLLAAVAAVSSYGYVRVRELLGIANENLGRALTAEEQAHAELRNSLCAQAHASRLSPQPGRRFECLDAVSRAAKLRPTQDELRSLRADAIAALATVDLRVAKALPLDRGATAAISPDLEKYATVDPADTGVGVHRLSDQTRIAFLPCEGAVYGSLHFSPDGRYLLSRRDLAADRIVIFEIESARQTYASSVPAQFTGISFHPRSRSVAWVAPGGGDVHHIELESGKELVRHAGRPGFDLLAFHPSGDRLALASTVDKQIIFIDPTTGERLTSVDDREGHVTLAWSADGTLFAAGCADASVSIWEERDGALVPGHVLEKVRTRVVWTTFNRKGTLLATYSWDPALRLYDPRTGDLLLTADLAGRAFSPDDRFITFHQSSGLSGVAEVAESEVCRVIVSPPGVTEAMSRVDVSRDGRLLACGRGDDGTVLFDLRERRYLPRPSGFEDALSLFTRDGAWLISRDHRRLQRWRLQQDADAASSPLLLPEPIAEAPTDASSWLAQSADASTLAILGMRNRGEILVYTQDGERWEKKSLGPHMNVDRIALRPDGKRLASGTWQGRDVKVWNVETGEVEHTIALRRNAFVEYSADGRWLVVVSPEACTIYDAVTVNEARRIEKVPQGGYTGRVAFRADCKVMAMTYDRSSILLVDPATGVQLAKLEARSPLTRTLAFQPDGSHVYCGTVNGDLFDWDLTLLRRELRRLGVDWVDPAE